MSTPEQQKLFRKHKITAKKHGGDDYASWAVFVGTAVAVCGLTRPEVDYYKRMVLRNLTAKDDAQ